SSRPGATTPRRHFGNARPHDSTSYFMQRFAAVHQASFHSGAQFIDQRRSYNESGRHSQQKAVIFSSEGPCMSPHSKSLSNPANSSENNGWRELYRAAILELELTRLPERILQAETALILRAKELFQNGGGNGQETQDLDDAMYALQALRSALRNNPSA